MAYIDYEYYSGTYNGKLVSADEFPRLAELASDIIDSIVYQPVLLVDGEADDNVKKAVAYEVDCLYSQGGEDAVNGFADGIASASETLGSHSESRGSSGNKVSIISHDGIPITRLTITLLRKANLMNRWAYFGVNPYG